MIRVASLELNWLPLSDRKALPSPRIVVRDVGWCAGAYYERAPRRKVDEELDVDLYEGAVLLVSSRWPDLMPGVLAHEHRHHQQRYVSTLPRIGPSVFRQARPWRVQIRRFYRSYPWEMDALRYQLRHAPDDAAREEMECVQ